MTDKSTAKLLKKICRKTGVTIRKTSMLAEGDHILVGLSGGKDSMILLEVLADRRASLPFNFDITAAHIHMDEIGYSANSDKMKVLCDELGIKFQEIHTRIPESGESEKDICFLCSWHRRKALFELSRELGCNKLALGHHRYDALETLLINMIYHGSISSMPYSLKMFEGKVQLIRPLLDQDEGLLEEYARLRSYGTEGKTCDHEHLNQRETIRRLIKDIEAIHGKAGINMYRAMDKIDEEYLPQKKARTS